MSTMNHDEIRNAVREQYAAIARAGLEGSCSPGCCGGGPGPEASLALGYLRLSTAFHPIITGRSA